MKRKLIGILALALVLSFSMMSASSTVEAHHGVKDRNGCHAKTHKCTYTDADNYGVCDNCNKIILTGTAYAQRRRSKCRH